MRTAYIVGAVAVAAAAAAMLAGGGPGGLRPESRVDVERRLLSLLEEHAAIDYERPARYRRNATDVINAEYARVLKTYASLLRDDDDRALLENPYFTVTNRCVGHDTLMHAALKFGYVASGRITKHLLRSGQTTAVTPAYLESCCGPTMTRLIRTTVDSGLFDLSGKDRLLSKTSPLCDAMTPLQIAVLYRQHSIIRLMLRSLKRPAPGTPVSHAVARVIADGGRSLFRMSAVHIAVTNHDSTTLQLLLAERPALTEDLYGRTALECAMTLRYDTMAAVLAAHFKVDDNAVAALRERIDELHKKFGIVQDNAPAPAAAAAQGRDADADAGADAVAAAEAEREAVAKEDWGGWDGPYSRVPATPRRCGVARVDAARQASSGGQDTSFNTAVFNRFFLSLQRPLVVDNAMEGWPAFDLWRKQELTERLRSVDVLAGAIPYGEIFGHTHGIASVAEIVEHMRERASDYTQNHGSSLRRASVPNESRLRWQWSDLLAFYAVSPPAYVFDADILREPRPDASEQERRQSLSGDFRFPDFLRGWNETERQYQFILGPMASGAPIHLHCDAFNTLVHGRKRWWLVPPDASFYSKVHPVQWLLEHEQVRDLDTLEMTERMTVMNKRQRFREIQAERRQRWEQDSEGGGGGYDPADDLEGVEIGTEVPDSSVFECEQTGGEVFYVPRFWGHATINLRETVGMAIEYNRGDC